VILGVTGVSEERYACGAGEDRVGSQRSGKPYDGQRAKSRRLPVTSLKTVVKSAIRSDSTSMIGELALSLKPR
jgi:hypothetical protein